MTTTTEALMALADAYADAQVNVASRHHRAALASALAEVVKDAERLRGIQPELPPRPPDMTDGLPRYGLRWNGPQQPLSTPMEDGYWTPWHIAEAERAALRKDAERYRWVYQFLSIDDVGDESACYSLVVDDGALNEAACRAKAWGILEYLDEAPTPDEAIDAALAARSAEQKGV